MELEEEVTSARREIVTDGYDMSVGEVMNLYSDDEFIISPAYQRYFRWDLSQKTAFLESILLNIPFPPIFVFQREDGTWELIDGLQRISTILEFVGKLVDADGETVEASTLEGTNHLPSLSGTTWKDLSHSLRLDVKRSRIRVEILKRASDERAKYDLFQRLNTGGSALSPQEVRNCVMAMIDMDFYRWVRELSQLPPFVDCTSISENQLSQQYDMELVLRFLVGLNIAHPKGQDVNEFVTEGMLDLIEKDDEFRTEQKRIFKDTFQFLNDCLGVGAFKKWDEEKEEFGGRFLISLFEVLSLGVADNLETLVELTQDQRCDRLSSRSKGLWDHDYFLENSGAGIRGSQRLGAFLEWAGEYMGGE